MNPIKLILVSLIHPSLPLAERLMDGYDCQKEIKENIEYDALCREYNREDVDEIVELIADTLSTTRLTVRVRGEDIPTEQVRERLFRLDKSHLKYVFDCLHQNTT